MDRCLVCGTKHAGCGPATTMLGVDERITERKEGTVGDLKRYTVEIPDRHGVTKTATLLLSDEDAAAQGLIKPAGKTAPTNKAAEPQETKVEPEVTDTAPAPAEQKRSRFGRK